MAAEALDCVAFQDGAISESWGQALGADTGWVSSHPAEPLCEGALLGARPEAPVGPSSGE